MKTVTFILYSLFFIPILTFAQGQGTGNGADAVICEGRDPELLDFKEAETDGLPISRISSGDLHEEIDKLFTAFRKIDPVRAKQYQNEYVDLLNDAELADQAISLNKTMDEVNSLLKVIAFKPTLPEIDDADRTTLPEDCYKKQLVVQRHPKLPIQIGQPTYQIHFKLWSKMNHFQRAITLFHEMIFREHLNAGAENSLYVRMQNADIFSGQSLESYLATLAKLKAAPYHVLYSYNLGQDVTYSKSYARAFDPAATDFKVMREGDIISIFAPQPSRNFSMANDGVLLNAENLQLMGWIEQHVAVAPDEWPTSVELLSLVLTANIATFIHDDSKREKISEENGASIKARFTKARSTWHEIEVEAELIGKADHLYIYDEKGTLRYVRDSDLDWISNLGSRTSGHFFQFDSNGRMIRTDAHDFADDALLDIFK